MSIDFTEQANKVLHYAQEEAQRFNSECVSTEHILLGLVKGVLNHAGKNNIAIEVFKFFGFTPRVIRLEVEKFLFTGPDVVSMGKLPLTPRAKQVITYAREEAETISRGFLGPEHILLGLLRGEEGIAAQVLARINFPKADEVRAKVVELDAQKVNQPVESLPQQTSPCIKVVPVSICREVELTLRFATGVELKLFNVLCEKNDIEGCKAEAGEKIKLLMTGLNDQVKITAACIRAREILG
jgi:ATP-dependent Clp protease ATP-binding subunit ClpA